jgi:hypothetical protein
VVQQLAGGQVPDVDNPIASQCDHPRAIAGKTEMTEASTPLDLLDPAGSFIIVFCRRRQLDRGPRQPPRCSRRQRLLRGWLGGGRGRHYQRQHQKQNAAEHEAGSSRTMATPFRRKEGLSLGKLIQGVAFVQGLPARISYPSRKKTKK